MRRSTPWMDQVDERILERLAEGDYDSWELSIDLAGAVSASRVYERLCILASAQFVEPYERETAEDRTETYWSFATWEQLYLDGDLDPNLDVPTPRPFPSYATRPGGWAGF